ncbi:unnamed protein product, partial [Brassica oleracea var. botrytis]
LIKQLDFPCPYQFRVGCLTPGESSRKSRSQSVP